MSPINIQILAAIGLVVYLVMTWIASVLLQLSGNNYWIFQGLMLLLGLAVALIVVVYNSRKTGGTQAKASSGEAATATDVDLVLRNAEGKLKLSKLGRAATLSNLPAVVVLGERDSTKTTVVVQSGIESELLAGQIYRDNAIVPTDSVNCWFAKGTIFIEAAGKILGDGSGWSHLIRRLRPRRLGAVGGGAQPSRAALVCVPCDDFLQPGASAASESLARKLRSHLDEIAARLGIRLPVYVLFTKADRIPFFTEYVRNMSSEEVADVVGATLPMDREQDAAVYAERASDRIGASFRNLVFALADRRPDMLAREFEATRLPAVYEFPRELAKLRSPMVRFLVDLCRPSQLRTAPFLRGFYFTGVRPIVLDDPVEHRPARAEVRRYDADSGATGMFRPGGGSSAPAQPPSVARPSGGRRVPQWTFLSHFFNDVLLKDRAALGASGSSTKTAASRRILLAAATALLLIFAGGMTVSYFQNGRLEQEVIGASRGILESPAAAAGSSSRENLERLETLRQSLERLTGYERDGAPWRLRWGLYSGTALYPEARKAYFTRFNELLLQPTQARLVNSLRALPAAPGPADDYSIPYDSLKAYLMTTSNHDKTTQAFLSPLLTTRWSDGRNASADEIALAQRQFDFYATELKIANPFSSENDTLVVERARRYLSQFAGMDRVYQAMLAEASQKSPSISFNRRFPGNADVLVNNREVSGAFSKEGFAAMSVAFKNPDRYFTGEQWVLGDQAPPTLDRAKLEQDLRSRYTNDFIRQWRAFLAASSITRYADVADAARKLNKLSGNQSPLLSLFSLVSENASVESTDIKNAFQPPLFVVPDSKAPIGPSNQLYMGALLGLQAALEQVVNTPGAEPPRAQAATKASEAKVLTRQLAQSFRPDPEGRVDATVQKLMEDPITNVEALVRNIVPSELNGQGRSLCSPVQSLLSKFPFNSNATTEATLAEMNAVFHPQQGSLWQFYNANLSKYLMLQGTQYVENPAGGVRLTPQFLMFWNRVAGFSATAYPNNSPQPRIPLTLRLAQSRSVESATLSIEGQSKQSKGASPEPMEFVWSGSGQPVTLNARLSGTDYNFGRYDGPWALFRFLADSENWTTSGGTSTFERIARQGLRGTPITTQDGTPVSVKFELETGRAPIFQRDYFGTLRCVSDIARP